MISRYSKIVPNHIFSKLDMEEYRNKTSSIKTNQNTFFQTLLKTTDKISASGSSNFYRYPVVPGINGKAKGTGYLKGEMTKFDFFS